MTEPSPKICLVCGHANPPERSACENCGIALVDRSKTHGAPKPVPNGITARNSGVNPERIAADPASDAPQSGEPAKRPSPSTLPIPRQLCPRCSHMNRVGATVCANCGQNLLPGAIASKGAVPPSEARRNPPDSHVVFPTLTTEDDQTNPIARSDQFEDDMILRLEIQGAPTPILIYPKAETIIGRRDPNSIIIPDVDLTALAGYRMGVSRQHVALYLKDKGLEVRDLGSSNGTTLNGTKLTPHHPHPLHNGDELSLGKMVMRVYFQAGTPKAET